jgi:hypothetical protein
MKKFAFAIVALSLTAIPVIERAIALEPDHLCYMQTSSGMVLDLTSVCTGQAISPTRNVAPAAQTPTPMANAKQRVDLETGEKLVNEGKGGYYDKEKGEAFDFNYEIWQDKKGTRFTLKVWESKNYPDGSPYRPHPTFRSAREALDHFDCRYARKAIAACPNNR